MSSSGFTGTQEGMTNSQIKGVEAVFRRLSLMYLHHGDCVGADADAHNIANAMGIKVIIHPPSNYIKRAFCAGYSEMMPEKPYLDRNRIIVNINTNLVATPKGPEKIRSGTWYTIRYARKLKRNIFIVWPDGKITEELNHEPARHD
jgi:hypothetical protein